MKKLSRLSTEHRNNLVAYLDGELPDKEAKSIEQVLSTSPIARSEVESLSQTWKLLDHLPRDKASEDFTARTISLLHVEVTHIPLEDRKWYQQARRGFICITWLAGLSIAAVIGFLITNQWMSDPAQEIVEEMPIIEKMDDYSEIGSLEFLDLLKKSRMFDEIPHEK